MVLTQKFSSEEVKESSLCTVKGNLDRRVKVISTRLEVLSSCADCAESEDISSLHLRKEG